MNGLTARDRRELCECEDVIQRGLGTFWEVGQALARIKDEQLYRDYGTWEEYCRQRWGMSRIHAYRLTQAAQVAQNLLPTGSIPPNESQARVLAPLPEDVQREVWEQARTDPTTAARLQELADRALAAMSPEEQAAVIGGEEEALLPTPAAPPARQTQRCPRCARCPKCGGTGRVPG